MVASPHIGFKCMQKIFLFERCEWHGLGADQPSNMWWLTVIDFVSCFHKFLWKKKLAGKPEEKGESHFHIHLALLFRNSRRGNERRWWTIFCFLPSKIPTAVREPWELLAVDIVSCALSKPGSSCWGNYEILAGVVCSRGVDEKGTFSSQMKESACSLFPLLPSRHVRSKAHGSTAGMRTSALAPPLKALEELQ